MARIAIIGDSTSVAGFRPLGLATFAVTTAEQMNAAWDEVVSGSYAVVFVTEPVFSELESRIAELRDAPVPAVTVIPGVGSPGGVGRAKIERAIERALGTSVLIGEEEA